MPELDFDGLCGIVSCELKPRIEAHKGLAVFARERSKFEGWLKVEIVDALIRNGYDAVPERGTIDVVCGETAVELKTVNTSYSYEGVVYKNKPITNNVDDVLNDISKLELLPYRTKAVVFAVFPLKHEHREWQNIHLPRIAKHVSLMNNSEITFANGVPGMIYVCELGQTYTHTYDAP